LEGRLGRLDQLHDVAREDRVALGRTAFADSAYEVGELECDRLGGVELWREDVTGSIGKVVLPEGLWVLVPHPGIEYADGFGAAVVVHDHLLAAHDHRAAELARRQPAQLDMSDRA